MVSMPFSSQLNKALTAFVGMSATGSIMILMIGISLGIITNVISVWGLSRAGRRPLMLRTLAIASLAWLGMGCVGSASGAVTKWYVIAQ